MCCSLPFGLVPGVSLAAAPPAAAAAAAAAAAEADVAPSLPLSLLGGFETVRLPGGERMGLASTAVLFGVGRGVWLGPVVLGAAGGQRGGLFVLGAELQRRWALRPGLELLTSLAIGGGGGAGAAVGNGLMLRPALALLQDFGALRAGVSASAVHFPGTAIRSRQLGLVVEWRGDFGHQAVDRVGERVAAVQRSGLGFDRIALTAAHLALDGNGQRIGFNLAGARFEQQLGGGSLWGAEAAAATRQAQAGYMEILGYAGHDWALGGPIRVGLRGALGLGGGGGVPAGGGLMARLDGTLSATLAPGWQAGASVGRVQGRAAGLRGQRAELWLAADLEPDGLPGTPGRSGTVGRTEWSGSLQHIARVARLDGTTHSVDTLGLALNRWLGAHAYATGQAHSALGGGAGGYSIGLFGAGWASAARPAPWQLGAELLLGGAGGGGVQSLTGGIVQAQLWAALAPAGAAGAWRLGLGSTAPLHGGGSASPLASLSWTVAFGQAGR